MVRLRSLGDLSSRTSCPCMLSTSKPGPRDYSSNCYCILLHVFTFTSDNIICTQVTTSQHPSLTNCSTPHPSQHPEFSCILGSLLLVSLQLPCSLIHLWKVLRFSAFLVAMIFRLFLHAVGCFRVPTQSVSLKSYSTSKVDQ